jgi:voltage-gated potassium channel
MTERVNADPVGLRLLERRLSRAFKKPVSIRGAARVIVTVTALTVLVSGVLMRAIDHKEFQNIWIGLWWAVQTVTTVGYGDIVPKDVAGRLVAVLVMLEGTALISIVTAAITSMFIERARHERDARSTEHAATDQATLEARIDDMSAKLDRIEASLSKDG